MNLETKIIIYKFTPQVFTLTLILLNYFLSCTYIVFPLFLFFLLFVRICNIAEIYITS